MMGLVLKESHRSWGFPIGVNTQHTSSASLFLQHRWVLEAPGRKVLIGECPCTQLCGWRTSMLNSSSCRPCVLLPRRKLLGLIFFFFVFKMWPGLIELWEGILFWGSIRRLCCSSMLSCFSKLLENDDLMDHSPALQWDRGWRLCTEELNSTLDSRAFAVLTASPLPPLQSLVLRSGGCGRQGKAETFTYAVTVFS